MKYSIRIKPECNIIHNGVLYEYHVEYVIAVTKAEYDYFKKYGIIIEEKELGCGNQDTTCAAQEQTKTVKRGRKNKSETGE